MFVKWSFTCVLFGYLCYCCCCYYAALPVATSMAKSLSIGLVSLRLSSTSINAQCLVTASMHACFSPSVRGGPLHRVK